ncbi:MAG: fasciclin domain-containing protein, partial [Cyanobacteria bacterium J06632_3]
MNKLAGVAAALMILPVAVACSSEPAADADADITSEYPEAVEEETATAEGATEGADELAAGESIVDVAAANGSFDTLVAAVQAAGLEEILDAEGPFTVFAPTDEAFAALPEGTVEKLVKPENQEALGQILAY